MDQQILNQEPPSVPHAHVGNSRLVPFSNRLSQLPWWALVTALLGVIIAWSMANDQAYQNIFGAIVSGVITTIFVTLIAYSCAVVGGLILALGRVSKNPVIYQTSTFFVEIVRGVPILVLLMYVAYVIIPAVATGLVSLGHSMMQSSTMIFIAQPLSNLKVRDIDNTFRAIIALTIAYAAFISEIFRAGIESVEVGQMEASRALGMTYWQAMRHIILRQAVRQALPPLGNDFIAMLKDSSLVSAVGVQDITMLGNYYAANTYDVFKPYNVVAFLYLVMTLLLSLVVKGIELRMSRERRQG